MFGAGAIQKDVSRDRDMFLSIELRPVAPLLNNYQLVVLVSMRSIVFIGVDIERMCPNEFGWIRKRSRDSHHYTALCGQYTWTTHTLTIIQ